MATAKDAARYLIGLAAADEESEYLTPLRLQKLLYYAQGWHLAVRGEPLFADRIEAWKYGPVVESVFQEFKRFGRNGIDPKALEAADSPSLLTNSETEHLDAIWETYKDFSAIRLSEMTHDEQPWRYARRGCAEGDRSCVEITCDSMKVYFSSLAQK